MLFLSTHRLNNPTESPRIARSQGHGPLIRWLTSTATLNVPQAASPIAFSLLALALTGDTSGGAAMILAMTLAQVVGVIPITRLGTRWPAATYLKTLVAARTVALLAIAVGAWYEAPLGVLICLAALAGLVNGAAHGYLRVILNHVVTATRLPRALGLAATLNELTFVLAPVAASGLGVISPVFAILAISVLGALPALLVPAVGAQPYVPPSLTHAAGKTLTPAIGLWLACAAATGAAIAAIEIGAVALALSFGYGPGYAVLFTVPLCLASMTGGLWVSVRNRMSSPRAVVVQLAVMSLGSLLVALETSVALTVFGAVLVGTVVAPLATYYSLILDKLAPPHKRAEVFALLRTANAVGVIFASALLTAASLSVALMAACTVVMLMTVCVGVASFKP